MKKLAVFAEGGTEQAFAEKLLLELAGAKNIQIQKEKIRGGGRSGARKTTLVEYSGTKGDHKYFAIIKDCGTDNRVTSDVRSNYKSLCRENFDCIIGIRDLRGNDVDGNPIGLSDLPRLRPLMKYGISRTPIDPVMVLAVMETEAWFLAEHTHFAQIDALLTLQKVIETLSFDPSTGDVEQRPTPADDLDAVYRAAGKQYTKTPTCIQRTIDSLDYAKVAFDLPSRVSEIRPLIDAVNDFLT